MSTEFKEFSAKKTQTDVFDILISTEKMGFFKNRFLAHVKNWSTIWAGIPWRYG